MGISEYFLVQNPSNEDTALYWNVKVKIRKLNELSSDDWCIYTKYTKHI